MTEPDNLTLVLVGSLNDSDPWHLWHLELWARDDANSEGSTARWWRAGVDYDNYAVQCVSWDWLQDHARECGSDLTVLRPDPKE